MKLPGLLLLSFWLLLLPVMLLLLALLVLLLLVLLLALLVLLLSRSRRRGSRNVPLTLTRTQQRLKKRRTMT